MTKKRVFISFAVEDSKFRDFIVGQARNEKSPFEFVDMSVKKPWDNAWKTNCRTKIKGCDGVVALISKNTKNADGQLWEVRCTRDEAIPIRGIYIDADDKPVSLPAELSGVRCTNWSWSNIASFIDSL
jgi:hypothetical protein